MKSRQTNHTQDRLFEKCLSLNLDHSHPLIQMSQLIDWISIEEEISQRFRTGRGQPPKPPKPIRLVVGILILQHMFDQSDE